MRMPPPLRPSLHLRRHLLAVGIVAIASTLAPAFAKATAGQARPDATAGQVRPDATTLNPAATGGFSPRDTPLTLGAAAYAKILCSAVFVSGRDEAEARKNSAFFLTPEAERAHVTTTIDRERKVVRATVRGVVTRSAGFYGDQGCVIHPEGTESVFFAPTPVTTTLPDPGSQPWPMGDVVPDAPWPAQLDKRGIDAAMDVAFSDPEALTAGMLVLYKGRIVAERYALGATAGTQLESWSMGKSLTATLVGMLIQQGALALDAPAPVPAWQGTDDPRRAITLSHLLRMSSGLHCTSPGDPDYAPDRDGYPAHVLIYSGAIDVFRFSTSRPLQFAPGTEGRYRNCDPITLGALVRQAVEARGEAYLTWPQRALFDRIGIRRQVLEPDAYGNFILSGFDYGTVRNWARLGLLYAQDGVWQGTRLLPEGFVKFVSTPAPGWATPRYGGLFWVNGTKELDAPPDAYWMAGAGGQRVIIIPSRDLVIVRLGHMRGDTIGMTLLDKAVRGIVDAVRVPSAQNPSPMSDTTRPHPRLVESRPAGKRATLSIGELFVPAESVARKRTAMPLVVHFHGASWLIEQHVARAAPHAALVTVNLGAGSGRYAAPFADPSKFSGLLEDAASATETVTGRRATWSSITLTSWSAGYGAVRAVLSQPDTASRVTAVVLLDSLHASYVIEGDPSAARTKDPAVDDAGLAVFTRLAADAAAGRTRVWVTHSEVYPGTYASTTDTANALLSSLNLTRRPVLKRGPLGMQQLSDAHRGGFHLMGFAGNSAPDHVDHLYALGDWLRAWNVVR